MDNSDPHCQSVLESPATITRRIEAYVTRGARDEERRAQKALLLLKARDQQISLLERRVAQLENAAADMHAITLQVKTSTPEISDTTSYLSIPRKSLRSSEPPEIRDDIHGNKFNKDQYDLKGKATEGDERQAVLVPELKLSTTPLSDSENDVFSTPVSPGPRDDGLGTHTKTSENMIGAAVSEETVYILRNGNESSKSSSSKQTSVDTLQRGKSSEHVPQANSTQVKDLDEAFRKTCNINIDNKILSDISGQIPNSNDRSLTLLIAAAALLRSSDIVTSRDPGEFDDNVKERSDLEVKESILSYGKLESSRSVKLSPSVPWVRTKRRLRRKSRGHELGLQFTKTDAILRAKDSRRQRPGFHSISKSLPAMNNATQIIPDNHNDDNERQYGDVAVVVGPTLNVKGGALHLTSSSVQNNEPSRFDLVVEKRDKNEMQNLECLSRTTVQAETVEDRKSSKYWSADDEPAPPQWLIEEALNKERELNVINRYEKPSYSCCPKNTEDISTLKMKYEKIISELEEKLNDVKVELEIAHKKKNNLKEKFKRVLQNTKMEAVRENEILQEKIVQICSSVLEKFGPYAFKGKMNSNGAKTNKSFKRYGKFSKKLRRKLRSTLIMSNKLRDELIKTKQVLGEKTREHESLDRRFTRLKQELETTELNLNNLINENSSLRKKFEDTREWMELKIGKDRNERNNLLQLKDMQKSREIVNLKKKVDEDFTTITQLRNKLLRSESANANKGFLLNSYKGQLADLVKEKDQGISKIKELENDLSQLRNTNAQLKAKISLLLGEKEKLVSVNEKSEVDLKEKMEMKLPLKYEQSMLNEIELIKTKCNKLLEAMRERMNVVENRSSEYSTAISEFLKRLNNHIKPSEMDSSFDDEEASHREAHKTACTILNMTPEELSGFMKGRPTNKINTWLTDFRKITSKSNFSDALANFLFNKISGSV